MTSWSDMFLEYFTIHRKMLIFTILLASLGMINLGQIVFVQTLSGFRCYEMILNDLPMLQHFGICGILQWLL